MPAGDSITFGLAGSGGGYRVELFKQAVEAGYDITFVGTAGNNGPSTVAGKPFPTAHEGISGERIPQLDARMTKTAPAQGSPHIFLIHIGTNDALSSSADTMASQLETLIDEVIDKNPDSLLVVSSLIPLSFAQSTIDSYNAKIPGIVQSRADVGMHIIYVDQSGFPASELGDGVHPNDTGYARMGRSWFAAIEEYLVK